MSAGDRKIAGERKIAPEILERLSAYIDDELSPAERASVEAQFDDDGQLAQQLRRYNELDSLLRDWATNAQTTDLATALSANPSQRDRIQVNQGEEFVDDNNKGPDADNAQPDRESSGSLDALTAAIADPRLSSDSDDSSPDLMAEDEDLVKERGESSVLFNLEALTSAVGTPMKASTVESRTTASNQSSGLIDIQNITEAIAAEGAPPQEMTAAAVSMEGVLPVAPRKSHKGLFIMLGAAGFVVVGLVVAIVLVLNNRGPDPAEDENSVVANAETETQAEVEAPEETVEEPETAQPPALDTEHVVAATVAGANLGNGIVASSETMAEGGGAAAVAENTSSRSERRSSRSSSDDDDDDDSRSSRSSSGSDDSSESSSSSSDEDEDDDSSSSGGGNRIDDALARIGRDEEEESGGAGLTSDQVRSTIRRASRRFGACREQAGLADGEVLRSDVDLVVSTSGSVRSVSASGPASSCIENVFNDISFPRFSGDNAEFTYPLRVR